MNSEKKKVSVVVPIYNVERYLQRCLDSILNQTYSNIEIILVNDGSTDTCPVICNTFKKAHTDTIYVEKENGGLVSAWMAGLEFVSGEYICFVDSDDFLASDYIYSLVDALEPDVDMVCMNCIRHFDNGVETNFHINSIPAGTYDVNDDLKSRIISDQGATFRAIATCRWAKIIRTDLVLKYSKYCSEQISYGEDQQLTVGIMAACQKIKIIDEYKYFYQFNQNSIVNSYKKELWKKVVLLIETIRSIPDISNIPEFEKQINTQFLMYCNECLKNEFYFGKLKRSYFNGLRAQKKVQRALGSYFTEKMRFLDRKMLEQIRKGKYQELRMLLFIYGLYCKIKKQPL